MGDRPRSVHGMTFFDSMVGFFTQRQAFCVIMLVIQSTTRSRQHQSQSDALPTTVEFP